MASKKALSEEDPGEQNHNYNYKKDFRTALPQIIAVSVKNCLLLVYGMTLGFPTILIPAVQNPVAGETLHLVPSEISWISSINLIMVPAGCALSGVVTTPLGRRRAMQLVNVPFFVAWLLLHFATSKGHLYGALFLTGLAGGLLEAPVLTYVAEITQPHLRGALTATSSMCIIIGVFMQFLLGLFLYWRTVAIVNIAFTVVAVLLLFFIPESPHWLISRKRLDDARLSLQWLRGWTSANAVEAELRDIHALYQDQSIGLESRDMNTSFKTDEVETFAKTMSHYMKKSFLVPFFLVSYSFFIGHFSGMTSLQTYAVSIFEMLDAPIDRYYATLILGLLQIIGSGLCVSLVHYTGKRPLALVSTAGAGLCCLMLAAYDGLLIHNYNKQEIENNSQIVSSDNGSSILSVDQEHNPYSWIPTVLLMMLALITHTGIRLLPWILIGEVFNAKTRSGGAGLASAVGYIFGFLTNKLYISMVDTIFIFGTYGLYSAVCLSGCVVLFFILPETEGKKLNEIENHFAGTKRLSNTVYQSQKKNAGESSKMQEIKGRVNQSYESDSTQI